MILPGRVTLLRNIVQNLRRTDDQVQPCGVDLTLKKILAWTSSGTVDFDNSRRITAQTEAIPFQPDTLIENPSDKGFIDLPLGAYLVEFNETVNVPLDVVGQIFVRSSLFRSGALIDAGVMDSGYHGAVGALLQVVNPKGIRLWEHARLGQIVFHQMSEPTDGYKGMYQGRETV
jgi:dUTP pyrophosphatase